jgi:hypothetical protein
MNLHWNFATYLMFVNFDTDMRFDLLRAVKMSVLDF